MMNKIKPVSYTAHGKREVLAQDTYKGYDFYVIYTGMHPCAYVCLKQEVKLDELNNINVHGSFTYYEPCLKLDDQTTIFGKPFLGWDYAHIGDFSPACPHEPHLKKWTTEEIIIECHSVIDQLQKII